MLRHNIHRAALCLSAALLATIVSLPGSGAMAELSDADKIARDLHLLTEGDLNGRRAAGDRLAQRGAEVVPEIVAMLASEDSITREMAADTLGHIGPDAAADGLDSLIEAARSETDALAMRGMTGAIQTITQDTEALIDLLLFHIERGGALAGQAAQDLFDVEADLSHAKPVLIEALSAGWTQDKSYLYWILARKVGLTPDDYTALARVTLGPKPVYWERPGDEPGDTVDNYSECRDWEYVVKPLSEALFEYPDAYLVFLRNHPGALSVFRENEPRFIYLFAEAHPETQPLRDYLVKREDLPPMFEIDLAAGERVGVLESYPTAGNLCFPQPELISVVVRNGRCDVADAPVPDGYAIEFGSGLARIEVDGLMGYTDEQGVNCIPPQFKWSGVFRNGSAWFQADEKIGLIDTEGNVLIPPRFERAHSISQGLQWVLEDELYGVITDAGTICIEPMFATIDYHYDRKQFVATTPEGVTGVINAEGSFIPDPE